jgi:hypothetical protein
LKISQQKIGQITVVDRLSRVSTLVLELVLVLVSTVTVVMRLVTCGIDVDVHFALLEVLVVLVLVLVVAVLQLHYMVQTSATTHVGAGMPADTSLLCPRDCEATRMRQ